MSKINVLDKVVFNRIAAGEVIDRPYSVVKELVENSIDAHATKITIEIKNGGKDLIKVTDDGDGIEKDDLEKAVMPHATSKISSVDDLDNIKTLGFRGEALASIVSVADVRISSKTANEDYGYSMKFTDGEAGKLNYDSINKGTVIAVENIFKRIPAREKFLKPNKTEENDIGNIVSRLMFAYPKCGFKFVSDDKVIYDFDAVTIEDKVIKVYGYETLKNCLKMTVEKNGITLWGFMGRDYFTKPNRTYQTLIVNNRYVVNNTVQTAIHNAYAPYLMKRQYPFYLIYIDISPKLIDVNVTPNKSDVRFVDNHTVYSTIFTVFKDALERSRDAIELSKLKNEALKSPIDVKKEQEAIRQIEAEYGISVAHSMEEVRKAKESEKAKNEYIEKIFAENKKYIEESELRKNQPPKYQWGFERQPENFDPFGIKERKRREANNEPGYISFDEFYQSDIMLPFEELSRLKQPYVKTRNEHIPIDESEDQPGFVKKGEYESKITDKMIAEMSMKSRVALIGKPEQEKIPFNPQIRVVGQVFRTYIVIEYDNNVYLIDQHAAHEKMLYDKYIEQYKNSKIVECQEMLIPYKFQANEEESNFLIEKNDEFRRMGFCISESEDCKTWTVYCIPMLFMGFSVNEFLSDILSDENFRHTDAPEILHEQIAQKACKAAIKSDKFLSDSEITVLLDQLKNDISLKCPHGRPIAVRITRKEMDKWFKRLV